MTALHLMKGHSVIRAERAVPTWGCRPKDSHDRGGERAGRLKSKSVSADNQVGPLYEGYDVLNVQKGNRAERCLVFNIIGYPFFLFIPP